MNDFDQEADDARLDPRAAREALAQAFAGDERSSPGGGDAGTGDERSSPGDDNDEDDDVRAEESPEDSPKQPDPEWTEDELREQERMVEALLFAAAEPLDAATLADRLPPGADAPALIRRLEERYRGRGVELSAVGAKWRFATAPDVAHVLDKERVQPKKLSRAALETLAVIAYHQPCTRADIEDVRGVALAKGSLDQLLEIGWVRLRGKRRSAPGRPSLYGTTDAFLAHFGLAAISDLPGLADLKAAGLLDARLPPGFSVPAPGDGDDEDGDDGAGRREGGDEASGEGGAPAFVADFLADEDDAETSSR